MNHNYTDAELQAAIDEACKEIRREHRGKVGTSLVIDTAAMPSTYKAEASARLDLIKAALASLPEPVDEESMLLNLLAVIHRDGGHYQAEHGTRKAVEDACKEWQRLIAIVEKTGLTEPPTVDGKTPGQVSLEAAVGATTGSFARTCDDPKTGELPMSEIPWIEWHGGECPLRDEEVDEWEIKFRDGGIDPHPNSPQKTRWHYIDTAGDIIAYRVLKWKAECGLSQLRPIAEAGEVPEGCVRVTGYKSQHSKTGWVVTDFTYHGVTHFADIMLTDAKAPAVEAEKPNPYAELKEAHADEPTPEPMSTKPISLPPTEGMTLRDYFAGQALIALPHLGCGADLDHYDTATAAYQIADAMIAAREAKP